jgi:L-alanine-DL-glutamate epimerase-like enolase superfamily enzyme
MTEAEFRKRWSVADRLSKGIVDLINVELAKKGTIDSVQILCGLLLGFKALEKSFPPNVPMPASLNVLQTAVNTALQEAFEYTKARTKE